MPITIAVIEVNQDFLSYSSGLIHSDSGLSLVGTAMNGFQGLQLVREVDADIYLLDLGLPDMSGLDLLSEIASIRADANAMVISEFDDEANILSAIERGAAGYLLKTIEPDAFISALYDLHAGTSPLSPAVARKLLDVVRNRILEKESQPAPAKRRNFPDAGILTERECQVLRELSLGLAFLEIAANLSISCHTVAQHVRNIYRKLGVGSRGRAVYEATKLGLLKD